MKFNAIFMSLCLLLACNKKSAESITIMPNKEVQNHNAQTYLALGDSYTIGESVKPSESFPFQLQALLNSSGYSFAQPKIIAKTGWTTGELQAAIKEENLNAVFDLVTLLIGVNNQYRSNSPATYRKEFAALLQQAIGFAGGNKKRVFVVSIPDWGATPFGKSSGRSQQTIAQEIDIFNAINKEEAKAMQVSYIDITPDSKNVTIDGALVANDGLHPSGKMYGEWAKALHQFILTLK